jgi:hypothetical protein
MDLVAERDQVWFTWWKEKQDEIVNMEPVKGSDPQPESAHRVWLVYSTKPTPSRGDVVVKLRVAWHGGYIEIHGVCGGSPQNLRVPWLPHKAKTGGSACGYRI